MNKKLKKSWTLWFFFFFGNWWHQFCIQSCILFRCYLCPQTFRSPQLSSYLDQTLLSVTGIRPMVSELWPIYSKPCPLQRYFHWWWPFFFFIDQFCSFLIVCGLVKAQHEIHKGRPVWTWMLFCWTLWAWHGCPNQLDFLSFSCDLSKTTFVIVLPYSQLGSYFLESIFKAFPVTKPSFKDLTYSNLSHGTRQIIA